MNQRSTVRKERITDKEFLMLDVWQRVLHKWWAVLLAAVLCGGCMFGLNWYAVAPTYQASFTAYINNSNQNNTNNSLSTADITAARNLTSTYSTILISKPNVESALKKAGIELTFEDVISGIQVNTVNNTEIIKVSVVTRDPDVSYRIATALQEVSPAYVSSIVVGSSMVVIEPAIFPIEIYGPNYIKRTLVAAVAGAFLMICYLILKILFDTRVTTVDDLSKYDYVVLGTIHDLASAGHKSGYYGYTKEKE